VLNQNLNHKIDLRQRNDKTEKNYNILIMIILRYLYLFISMFRRQWDVPVEIHCEALGQEILKLRVAGL